MMLVMDEWTKLLDHWTAVDIIYLDFMKAFDKVSHSHLLHKLHPALYDDDDDDDEVIVWLFSSMGW